MAHSTGFNIYDHATQKQIDNFRPTFLYIKQHRNTGLLYFGKKSASGKNIELYTGSGTYWLDHISIHGKDIETVWYCLFTDISSLVEMALCMTEIMNIVRKKVDGKKIFANLINENGLTGGAPGRIYTDEDILKMSVNHWARKITLKEDNPNFGSKRNPSVGKKISAKAMGNTRAAGPRTAAAREKMSEMRRGIVNVSDEKKSEMIKRYQDIIAYYNTSPPIVGNITSTGSKSTTYKTYVAAFAATYCHKWNMTSAGVRNVINRKPLLSKHL